MTAETSGYKANKKQTRKIRDKRRKE